MVETCSGLNRDDRFACSMEMKGKMRKHKMKMERLMAEKKTGLDSTIEAARIVAERLADVQRERDALEIAVPEVMRGGTNVDSTRDPRRQPREKQPQGAAAS